MLVAAPIRRPFFAYTNRAAKVVAIDISQSSLSHHRYLKDKHGLQNLELHLLPIEDLATLGADFDLIVSTGVLHHMADPLAGMQSLAGCLRRDGAMGLMLYAKYGRTGINLLQSVFRDLGLGQDEASVQMVRETLSFATGGSPCPSLFQNRARIQYDAGLVDTFMHSREETFTVDECIDLVTSAGLIFQAWYFNGPYYPNGCGLAPGTELFAAINALPESKIWSVMERLHTTNACHSFIACRPDRSKEQYTIDFSARDSLDYIPLMRIGCRLIGTEIIQPKGNIRLNAIQLAFAQNVDGRRTIREIAACVGQSGPWPLDSAADLELFAREFFESLWRVDMLAMTLKPRPAA